MNNPNAWRSVPLAELREWYADQASMSSLRAVGEKCGVGHSTLSAFIRYTDRAPHPRNRRLLAVWYLQNVSGLPVAVRNAFDLLLGGVPDEQGEEARRGLLDAVADVYRSAGVEPPSWTGR
jgi:hypothetical protein